MPNLPYLFFLTNKNGNPYYLSSGMLLTCNISAVPSGVIPWLPEAPDGWMDTQVSFARNAKYYGINRSFIPPLKFAGDGATIIRTLFYGGAGIEAEVFLVIVKFNSQTGVYEAYYRGELDLTKIDDSVADFCTVNVLESGILKYLKANENNVYEIPCDGSLPEHVSINMDGMLLDNKSYFGSIEFDYRSVLDAQAWTLGIVFFNSDGQSPNVIVGTQDPVKMGFFSSVLADYVASSKNFIYSSTQPSTITITGSLQFVKTEGFDGYNTKIYFLTSLQNEYILFDGPTNLNDTHVIDVNVTISLAPNENLFLILLNDPSHGVATHHFSETKLQIFYSARYQTTNCWGFKPLDLYKRLVSLMTEGQYNGTSELLNQFSNLVCTSGLAIRQIDKAVIKTSLSDFFVSFNAILNGAIGVGAAGITLFFERKRTVYNPDTVDMDLGEVSELKISVQTAYYFNNLKIGYPNNDYDSSNGLNEWNTTAQWNAPVTKIQTGFELISKYRADSYGIEFTRTLTPGNNTVNNKSDNDIFIINVDKTSGDGFTGSVSFVSNSGLGFIIVPVGKNFRAGQVFTVTGSASNDGTKTVIAVVTLFFFGLAIYVAEPLTDEATVTVTIAFVSGFVYDLLRPAYDSITGIVHPESSYNIEDLTPKRMLLKWGNYIRGVLYNFINLQISFLSIDKNKNLATTLEGVSIVEATNVTIGDLDSPLFYPYIIGFKTKVPLTFEQIMTNAVNGHIKLSYNGKTLYGFPMEVTVKPTLNESQDWKLLLSPLTKLTDLINLDISGLAFLEQNDLTMFIPFLSPVQFVKLGAVLPAQYHFKHMDEWWYSEQIQFYVDQPRYAQKWQTSDSIKLQVQTNGLGPVQVDLLDCHGAVQRSTAFSIKSDPAIVAPITLYEGNMVLTSLPEGIYYMLITAGTGSTISQAISEPLHVAEDHPITLLLEYSGTRNKQSTIFSTGYNPSFRFEGWLDGFNAAGTFASYVDQPADIELMNGIPFRTHKLNVGNKAGVPDYVADKVNRILLIGIGNKTFIDGLQMTRNDGANMESTVFPGSPLKYWTLDIRESLNKDGITVPTTDNGDQSELTVEYNIETKAFGDGSPDNIVQVIEVD